MPAYFNAHLHRGGTFIAIALRGLIAGVGFRRIMQMGLRKSKANYK